MFRPLRLNSTCSYYLKRPLIHLKLYEFVLIKSIFINNWIKNYHMISIIRRQKRNKKIWVKKNNIIT